MSDSSAPEAIISRIEEQRLLRGMTQRALAEEAGLSTSQMSRLMTHDRKLTAGDLGAIARALGVSPSLLLGQPEAERPLAVAQRLGREGRAADLDGPFDRAQDLLNLRDLLDQLFVRDNESSPVQVAVPTTTYYELAGIKLASRVREALGLGHGPIEDVEALAARFNMDVATQAMPDGLHGLLVAQRTAAAGAGSWGAGVSAPAMALLNASDTNGKRRYTVVHELGHLLFADSKLYIADWADAKLDKRSKLIEHRADCFAAHLLAPDAAVRAVAEEVTAELGAPLAHMPDADLDGADEDAVISAVTLWVGTVVGRLAGRYGISVMSALIRAETSKVVTPAQRHLLEDERWSATHILTMGGENPHDVAAADGEVAPPFVMLHQALSAYQSGMLGLRPLATLYDTDDMDALAGDIASSGWAPEYSGGEPEPSFKG